VAEAPVTGARKAAIALVAMGEEASAALLKHFPEEEIELIAREIAALGAVPAALNDQVLTELRQAAVDSGATTIGGMDQARRLLARSLGPDQSRRILDRVTQAVHAKAGFASLEKANPQQLVKFILGEHPQTIALILAHLTAPAAARLLAALPDDVRADALMRMASLEDIPPEVVARVSDVIDQRVKALGGPRREQKGGLRAVAELFNQLDKGMSKAALERIEASAPEMAVSIRNFMFVFDDLIHVEDAGIREIINRADKRELTIALKGASEDVRQRFMANMAKRAAELLKEEMDMLGAVKLRDVEKAQQAVVAVARALEEEGVIQTSDGGAGEAYVA